MQHLFVFLCANQMRYFFLLGKALVAVEAILVVVVIVLVAISSPPKGLLKSYPWRTRIRFIIPFTQSWRSEVSFDHVESIQNFRRGMFTVFLIMISGPVVGSLCQLLGHRLLYMLATGQCGQ